MFGDKIHRYLFVFFLSGIAFSLPLSEFFTSAFTIALVSNWLLTVDSWRRLRNFFSNRPLLIFMSIYFLYVVFLINTDDLTAGILVLKLKLPLLAIPLVIGNTRVLSSNELRVVLSSFILGVFIASITGTFDYFILSEGISDRRNISLFISHIRLSLMVCFSFFISSYYTVIHDNTDFRFKYAYALFALWFAAFLLILLSLTGIIIFIVLVFFSSYRIITRYVNKAYSGISIIVMVAIFLMILGYLGYVTIDFYSVKENYLPDYEELTAGGRKYTHDTDKKFLENGYYVWRYICDEELRSEWNRRSTLDYDGSDLRGQEIRHTIIRYMTSLGIRKDSVGIWKLTGEDINSIESGHANCRYRDGVSLSDRVYDLVWQLDHYFKGGNPQGNSVTQRLEFFITGWNVFKKYPLFGTGTGDLVDEYMLQYQDGGSKLDSKHRRISHNQYLTVLVRFGITGFILYIFALFYPVYKLKTGNNFLAPVFFIIIFLSMLNEDTLESITGIVFFSLFYSLFVFSGEK